VCLRAVVRPHNCQVTGATATLSYTGHLPETRDQSKSRSWEGSGDSTRVVPPHTWLRKLLHYPFVIGSKKRRSSPIPNRRNTLQYGVIAREWIDSKQAVQRSIAP
jgi:hypothetical protein